MTNKLVYEKPTIVRHTVGVMNKFGRPPATVPLATIEGKSTKQLTEKYGSPLYILSESALRRRYREMQRAFSLRYPSAQIAYSYKTNYLSAVCSILHQEGAWAEVVSGFEYSIAEALGVPGEQIVFNGPYKTRDELTRAIQNGSIVNIDNYDEMYLLEEIAREMGKTIEIGIRINMDLNYPPWHKFGFNLESGHAFDAVRRAESNNLLKVVGLHCHAGTYIDDLEIYRNMAYKYVDFYRVIKSELGVHLKYWDVGGGYASENTLHVAWQPAEQTCPTFDQYAEAICPILLSGPFESNEAPKLFMEPGRAIVDETMHLITTVVAQKRLPDGSRGIVLDAGMNLLSSVQWYKYNYQTAQESGQMLEDTTIFGGLCMNIDVLRTGVQLPPLRRGDLLVVKDIGAYNLSQSWQFIYTRPTVLAIAANGDEEIVRKKENVEFVRQMDVVPERFKIK
ncbi:alanine racemase [bacterium]|nr:alanine racemase [bacterium]